MSKIKILSSCAGYNLAADDYDKKEKYLNSFEKGKIHPLLGELTNQKILDVGAGTGRLAVEMVKKGNEVTALDISQEMLKILSRKNKKIKIVVGDAEHLPFGDESFDWVVAVFLIVHLKDPSCFFDQAYRVLKSGGRLLVTNINQKEPPEIKTKQGAIKIESYYHRPEKIINMLSDLAFSIEKEFIVTENNNWVSQIIVVRK